MRGRERDRARERRGREWEQAERRCMDKKEDVDVTYLKKTFF